MILTPPILHSLADANLPNVPLHLALGMFDGVHLGHQAVVETAVHSARREGGTSGIFTFYPHPSHILRPSHPVLQILPLLLKYAALKALGVDHCLFYAFTLTFAKIEASDFLPYLKKHLPSLAAIYVGENFRFGHSRKGDVALLISTANALGVDVFSVPQLQYNGEAISSTRIREALTNGNITLANHLLGRTYTVEGTVTEGAKRGRTIGCPTLNCPWEAELHPKFGVYTVSVRLKGTSEAFQPAVANFGIRPTIGDLPSNAPLLEVHVLNGSTSLTTDNRLEIAFHTFIRPEAKFKNLDDLKAAIAKDVQRAKDFFQS